MSSFTTVEKLHIDDISKYMALSQLYLKNADGMIKLKEYSKAGEMLWGSIATLLKALGTKYGKPISNHSELIAVAKYIALAENDNELRESIVKYAQGLHANYYENWIDNEEFPEHYARVIMACSKLFKIVMKSELVS